MKTKFSMQRAKILATQLAWEFIGSVFIAAGIYNFAVQAKFPMTGFSGISIILYRLLNIPIGFSTILLNIPLAIICYRLLGRKFFISSLRCMVISSLMIDYVAPLFPVYEGDRLLAALCTGVFGGIGYALIYSKNSSTGAYLTEVTTEEATHGKYKFDYIFVNDAFKSSIKADKVFAPYSTEFSDHSYLYVETI